MEVSLRASGCYSAVQLVLTPVCFAHFRMYCTISVHIAKLSVGRKPGTTGICSVPVVCNLPDIKVSSRFLKFILVYLHSTVLVVKDRLASRELHHCGFVLTENF